MGKLPEIRTTESARGTGSRNKGKHVERESERGISSLSTAYKTELSVQTKPLVDDVDVEKKSEKADETPFWEWQAKQLDYLNLPVFHAPPKSAQRAFSTDRSKKAKAVRLASDYIDSDEDDQSEQISKMNKSAYAGLPSKEEDEEDTLLSTHRLQCIEEKYSRKGRWVVKVEKEDKRTSQNASVASKRATSCRDAINKTMNEDDNVRKYKNLLTSMNHACENKLKQIEQDAAKKPSPRGRRLLAALPVAPQPKMTADEHKIWKTDWQKQRFGKASSVNRWQTSTGANVNTTVPVIKKTQIKKLAKTPNRYSCFAPQEVRDLILRNRANILDRVKVLNQMNKNEDDE